MPEPIQRYSVLLGELGFQLPSQGDAAVACVVTDPETDQQIRLYLKVDRQTMWTAYYALKKQVENLGPQSPAK